MASWGAWIADALVILGSVIMTIGIYGMLRMPDIYTKLHAASKSAFLGVNSFVAASLVTGDPAIITRVLLIGAVLILTTPVASHVIGRAGYLEHLPMISREAVDESGHRLADAEAVPTTLTLPQAEVPGTASSRGTGRPPIDQP